MIFENHDLLMRLYTSNQKLHKIIAKEFDSVGINKSEFFLMCIIHKNKTSATKPTLSEISDEISVSKPAVTQMAVNLKKKGLITRSYDKKDARRIHFRLTQKGEELMRSQAMAFLGAITSAFQDAGIDNANNYINIFEGIVNSIEKSLAQNEGGTI